MEHSSTTTSPFGSHVDDVVRHFYDVEVMFYDDHRVTLVYESLQHVHQHTYILEVQTRRRLVQDV